MKRIIFLIVLTVLFSVQNTYAEPQKDGVCLKYDQSDCVKFSYCTAKNSSGCTGYETCELENNKFACVNQMDSATKVYRPLNFVDEKVRNLRKPTYTDPIVQETLNKPIVDYFYPVENISRYGKINEPDYKTYYPPKDGPYTLGETYPRRDVWVDSNPPYYTNLFKRKYPVRHNHYGAWRTYY